jgi:hypothetical protein
MEGVLMRKLLLALILVCIMITPLLAGDISRTLYFDFPQTTNENNNQIILPGCLTIANPGETMLPRRGLSLLLPAGEQAVSIEYNFGERVKLDGKFYIEPAQQQHPLSQSGPFEPTIADANIYQSNEKYPVRPEANLSTQYFRGHGIAFVDVCPMEYYPESGELYYYPQIEIKIKTELTVSAQSTRNGFLKTNRSTNDCLSRMIDNPEMIGAFYGQTSLDIDDDGNYDYLIISRADIAGPLTDLIDDKNGKGILTELMDVDDIYNTYPGADNQEKIRNCIIDQYQNHGIEYVLLAGDDEIIPHRGFYATDESSVFDSDIPADYYYCGLDGNWNTNNDDKWAEPGEDDLVGEVFIGRMAVDTETEMTNFVNKTLMYQNQPCVESIDKALMVGEYLGYGWDMWGSDSKEEIRLGSSNWGYTTAGFPSNFDVNTLYERDQEWSGTDDLIPLYNSGLNLINHVGHCSVDYMMKYYSTDVTDDIFTNDGINTGFYILYSQGCYCGSFDNRDNYGSYQQDCITEDMTTLQHGPVAMITNSRYGWGNKTTTNGSSQYYDRQFFDALFGENISKIGEVQLDSKVDNISFIDYGENRWCYYCCNLFGDPTLDIWTDDPRQVYATHNSAYMIGQYEFQVVLSTDEEEPIANANVGLTFDGVCVGSGITDETGTAIIDIIGDITHTGDMQIVATSHNFVRYESTIQVMPAEGPFIIYECYEIDDEANGNDNGLLDYGETVNVWLSLENVGLEDAENVTAEITATDDYLFISDNNCHFDDMASGMTARAQDCITMVISPNCPDNHIFNFYIEMQADNHQEPWTKELTINAHAPKIVLQSFSIDDSGGNNDGLIDPGETVTFMASLTNIGGSDMGGLTANLFTNNPHLNITNNGVSGDAIPVGTTVNLDSPITITADSECPYPIETGVTLSAYTNNGFFASVIAELLIGMVKEDFESGEGDWIHYNVSYDYVDQWHLSETRNHTESGGYSWKCGDTGSDNYAVSLDAGLESPSFEITDNCVLQYWQWIFMEASSSFPGYAYDAGIVEISTDDGDTWTQITPVGGYTHLIRGGSNPCPFPAETPCFSGETDWQEIEFDLTDYSGSFAKFRFRAGSDAVICKEGWYIDDLKVTILSNYPAPSELSAGLNNEDQALIAWNQPETAEPTGYNIYRSSQIGQYSDEPINDLPVTTAYYIDEECVLTHNNFYVVTAVYEGSIESSFSNEALLAQLIVDIDDDQDALPAEFELLQNYPNPFNPLTTIQFNLPKQAHVNIAIYDILGRRVETLVDDDRTAGYHQVTWNASGYASGIYFYRISADDFDESRKMIMLK